MKKAIIALFVFSFLLGLAACGGSGAQSCGTQTSTVSVQYVYVANESAQSVSGYLLSSSGVLTSVGAATPTGGNGPETILFDPASKLLFVWNRLSQNISVMKVDPQTGLPTPVSGSPFSAPAQQMTALALHPTGKYLYALDSLNGIYVFTVSSTTGQLTPVSGSPFATGLVQSEFLVASPSGKYVYVASNAAPATVVAFSVVASTGALLKVPQTFDLGSHVPAEMQSDIFGDVLFSLTDTGTLSILLIDQTDGTLTEVIGSPLDLGSSGSPKMANLGNFIYLLDPSLRTITTYVVQSDGTVTTQPDLTLDGVLTPAGMAIDSTGNYLVVTDASGAAVRTYSIKGDTGVLTAVGNSVAAGSGAGHITSGRVTKQVSTPLPCSDGGSSKGWGS